MHPIFGQQEVNQNIPMQSTYGHGPPPTDYSNQQQQQISYGTQPQQNNFMTPGNYGPPQSNQYNQSTFMPSMVNDQQQQGSWNNQGQDQQQHQQQQVQRAQPAAPVEKKPIPNEYLHIQKTFEDLRVKCIQASNNPQAKRKLEDVAKRLEFLYDILREARVSFLFFINNLNSNNNINKNLINYNLHLRSHKTPWIH